MTRVIRRGANAVKLPRRASTVPTEHAEQCVLFALIDAWAERYPVLHCVYAIPNEMGIGGRGGRIIGAKRKASGRRAGVPDINCDVPRGPYHGLRLELKRVKGGVVSPEQRVWHERLRAQGYRVEVCRGADEAWAVLCDYLELPARLVTRSEAA